MDLWDGAAHDRLKQIVADLRGEGVLDLFERLVARVWKFNVDRHEPSEIGDTNLSLGITAKENITSLVVREAWMTGNSGDLSESVHVSVSKGSLLVRAAGVRVRMMKSAASPTLREPRWDSDFIWENESDVRAAAAASNRDSYNPFIIGPGSLFENIFPPTGSVEQLRETMLVWAGGSDSPFTGGWLGLPTMGERPWLAVENLWWHELDADGRIPLGGDKTPDADTFSNREAPKPSITLKPRPKTAEQGQQSNE